MFRSHFIERRRYEKKNRQASNTPRQLNNELNQTLHEVDEDYELEIGNYNPVQTLFNDHGISLISLSSTSYNKIDHHLLQVIFFYTQFREKQFHEKYFSRLDNASWNDSGALGARHANRLILRVLSP